MLKYFFIIFTLLSSYSYAQRAPTSVPSIQIYGSPTLNSTLVFCSNSLITSSSIGCPVSPSAPQSFAAGSPTSTTIPLTWTAPATGNPTSFTYTVSYTLHGNSTFIVANSSISGLSYTITGLNNSTAYDVKITATNSYSTGPVATLSNVSTAGSGVSNNYISDGASGFVTIGSGFVLIAQ